MDIGTFLISIILLVIGLKLLSLFLLPIAKGLRVPLNDLLGKNKYRKAEQDLIKADALIHDGEFSRAIQGLRQSILLDDFTSTRLVSVVRNHHKNVLSRCLIVAEELHSETELLPDVEHLLMQRSDLLQLLIKAKESYAVFLSKRTSSGKPTPDWSKSDYEKRIRSIQEELKTNAEDLVKSADKLFEQILVTRRQSEVTLH